MSDTPTPLGWKPIEDAPAGADLCLCIEDGFGVYRLPFPCRRQGQRWVNALRNVPLDIAPMGWVEWGKRQNRRSRFS